MSTHLHVRRLASALLAAIGCAALVGLGPAPAASATPLVATPARSAAVAQNWAVLRFLPAMQAAGSVLGTPYRYGGSSPGGFDCSGLVQWSFGHAGIGLPRDSRSQRAATFPIGEWEAQPGDLVFYGSPVHHVGIYMGNGEMIHSPRSGGVVSIVPVHRNGMSAPSFGRIK